MKRWIIALVLAAGITTAAAAAEVVYWARAYADPARLAGDLGRFDFDVAGAAAGDHFDLIATGEDLAALSRQGISYKVLQEIDPRAAPPSEYTEYAELVPELQRLANTYPNIAKLYDVGDTWENREIWALKISDHPATAEAAETDILIDGCHHAREIMTVEVPLYLAQQLCENYPADPDVKLIVDNVETWIIPMLNPDGHNWVFTQYSMWRKNRRNNGGGSYGVDLNRNYDYHWGESGSSHNPWSNTYCGPYAFSEPETVAVRDLLNDANNQFGYTLNYHSYGKVCLYPWAYTYGHPPEPDYQYFKDLSEYLLQTLPGWQHGNDWEMLGYLASGNAVDWDYDGSGHSKDWGLTFEIDNQFQPPAYQIPITCAEQYPVLLKLLKLGVCPLGVNVSGLRARGVPRGVKVRWEATREGEVAGFNLYRRPKGDGPAAPAYVKLNRNLIAGRSPYTYLDDNAENGRDYEYLLEAVDLRGRTETFGPATARAGGKAVAKAVALYQNWPNPAREATTIKFELAAAAPATLEVFDCAGRKIRTLFAGPGQAGPNEVTWDLRTDAGQPVAAGVYVYRLRAGGETLSRKLVTAR